MLKVILTRGLPGSGKSTWAKTMMGDSYKRVNKDDLREMLDNSHFSKSNEKFILKIRDKIILSALEDGKHVIVDDTNLNPKHLNHIEELVKGKAEVKIKDFTTVSLEKCIERDLKRINSVGEKVIRDMYNKYLKITEEYVESKELPHAIIVDIDGTLSKMNDRSPYDWSKVGEDFCQEHIKSIVDTYQGKVIIMSGRDGCCKSETTSWLRKHEIKYDLLLMRDEGTTEKDSIIKKRLFDNNIKGKYYIDFVLDDRNQVVEMWRNIGLNCLQVAEGNF